MLSKYTLRVTLSALLALILVLPHLLITPASAIGPDKVDPALRALMTSHPNTLLPVIVEMTPPAPPFSAGSNASRTLEAVALLNGLGAEGRAIGGLPLITSAAGFATSTGITLLEADPRVLYIHEDSLIQPRRSSRGGILLPPPGLLAAAYPRVVGADKVWSRGITGQGVGVAVLDSGIAPHADLTTPTNRILTAVNFVGDPEGLPDKGGHGTHVAGIIAGNGTRSRSSGNGILGEAYVGIAPGANLVDVRVIDQQGRGRVSSVVRGIEWVLAHQAEYNIRVMNLSLGAPAQRSYRIDPLTAAVETAWQRGIVVVAASGNDGPSRDTLHTPGIDPYIITVGATDDAQTLQLGDDTLNWFSSWGIPAGGQPKPDVVAPGRRIVSLRVPGSYLDQMYPDRVISNATGTQYFRLTGTSMSTGVVSGIVALMLESRPALTPDQVKAILMGTTQRYGGDTRLPDAIADGAGLVNANAAVISPILPDANQGLRPASTFARTLYPIIYGQPLTWRDPDLGGVAWDDLAWDDLAWDDLAWDNLRWDDLAWDDLAWDDLAWDDLAWDDLAWDDLAWDDLAWDDLAWDNYGPLD